MRHESGEKKPATGTLKLVFGSGSPRRTRTADPVINSHLLYRLSYRGRVRRAAHDADCTEVSSSVLDKNVMGDQLICDFFDVDRRLSVTDLKNLRKSRGYRLD